MFTLNVVLYYTEKETESERDRERERETNTRTHVCNIIIGWIFLKNILKKKKPYASSKVLKIIIPKTEYRISKRKIFVRFSFNEWCTYT